MPKSQTTKESRGAGTRTLIPVPGLEPLPTHRPQFHICSQNLLSRRAAKYKGVCLLLGAGLAPTCPSRGTTSESRTEMRGEVMPDLRCPLPLLRVQAVPKDSHLSCKLLSLPSRPRHSLLGEGPSFLRILLAIQYVYQEETTKLRNTHPTPSLTRSANLLSC